MTHPGARVLRIAPILFCIVFCIVVPRSAGGQSESPTWTEPLTGMEFVRVPEGCVALRPGASENVEKLCSEEFWMGKTEVTSGQFQTFVKATGYRTEAENEGFSWGYSGEWEKKAGLNRTAPGIEEGDSRPVVHVTWNDAKAMAEWLSKSGAGRFGLPTENEWEYACHGGNPSSEPWGDTRSNACKYADIADISARERFPAWVVFDCEDGHVATAPVGSYQPNAFGLYDTVGNVWEWVEDVRDTSGGVRDRSKPSAPMDSRRAVRGGSWNSRPGNASCSARDILQAPSRRSSDIGFRLIRLP